MVIFHDDRIPSGREVHGLTHRELAEELGPEAMTLDELLDVAAGRVGLHLDLKETGYEGEGVRAPPAPSPAAPFALTPIPYHTPPIHHPIPHTRPARPTD